MATNNVSDISGETIDGEFPVAGIDNDTQGFRDNFSIIKSDLSIAKQEITDLYQRTPKLDEENNFDGSIIAQASLKAVTEETFAAGTFSQTEATIDFTNGHYQIVKLGEISTGGSVINNIEISLDGWPQLDNQVSKMRIQLSTISESLTVVVNWPGTYKVSENWPGSDFTVDNSDTVVEFWTPNKGQTVYANYIGKFA